MKIVPAIEADLPALAAVERSAAQVFRGFDDLAWLADGAVQPIERHRTLMRSGTNWVARSDTGKAVGFLSAEMLGEELHIWELSVCSNHQGRGLGRALMRRAIEEARLRQLKAVTLTTFRDVPWNAPFYERLGFRILEPQQMSERLRDSLEREAASGMPIARRCAMLLAIA
jgi:ribosomal protein S18 acetylase RimI-like enzyme